jgi:hypothetical protein
MSNFNNNSDDRDQQRGTNTAPAPNAFDDPVAEYLLIGADEATRRGIYSRAATMEQMQLQLIAAASQQQQQADNNTSDGVWPLSLRSAGTGGPPPSRLSATGDLLLALRQENQGQRDQHCLQQLLLQSHANAQARAQHTAASFAAARQQALNPAASRSHHPLSAAAQAQQGSAGSSSAGFEEHLMLLDRHRMVTQPHERTQWLQQERRIMLRVRDGNLLDKQLLLQNLAQKQQQTARSTPPTWAQLEATVSKLRQARGSPTTSAPRSQGSHGGGSNLGSLLQMQERFQAEQASLLAGSQEQMSSTECFPQQQQMPLQAPSAAALTVDPDSYLRLTAHNTPYAISSESLYALGGDSNSHDKNQRRKNFPEKLMDLLNMPAAEHIVCWLPHGKSFMIVRPKMFATDIMPSYFRQAKYASFTRKLNRWGFRQVTKGPEHGAFHHDLFQRGKPILCLKMFCGGTAYPKSAAKRRAAAATAAKAADAINPFADQFADQGADVSILDAGDDSFASENSEEEVKEKGENTANIENESTNYITAVVALALNLNKSSSSDRKIPSPQLNSCFGRGA